MIQVMGAFIVRVYHNGQIKMLEEYCEDGDIKHVAVRIFTNMRGAKEKHKEFKVHLFSDNDYRYDIEYREGYTFE